MQTSAKLNWPTESPAGGRDSWHYLSRTPYTMSPVHTQCVLVEYLVYSWAIRSGPAEYVQDKIILVWHI